MDHTKSESMCDPEISQIHISRQNVLPATLHPLFLMKVQVRKGIIEVSKNLRRDKRISKSRFLSQMLRKPIYVGQD